MGKKGKIIFIALLALLAAGSYIIRQEFFRAGQEKIQASGTIEATSVDLHAKLAGSIERLAIKAGDTVKKGQLVAELSRNDLAAQRERDELSVLKSEAGLADLQSGARAQEIKEAEANVSIALANLNRATDEIVRLEALLEEGAITRVEFEKACTAVEICKSQLQAAEARVNLLMAGSRREVINAARMEVDRNKAILKATDAMLEDLKIYSPIDGVVVSKNYEPGEYIMAGASLATVVNMDDLWIKVYIPTDDLPKVALGQKVTFTVSGWPESFEGVVEEIAARGEFTPKTIQTKQERTNVVFAVKIRISSEGNVLKPGMPADVVFSGGEGDD